MLYTQFPYFGGSQDFKAGRVNLEYWMYQLGTITRADLMRLEALVANTEQVVLEAQYAAIEKTVPGNHWNEPHEAAVKTARNRLLVVSTAVTVTISSMSEVARRSGCSSKSQV